MQQPFNEYSQYYDLLYLDKDYENEANYIINTLARLGIESGDLLEYGSGTGKHGRLISKDKFTVHGIERSVEMVTQTIQNERFTCQQGDICSVQLDRKFDAVISLFHVISYMISNESISAVFDQASFHLKPGGIFLFDVWYTPAVYHQYPQVKIKKAKNDTIGITRIAEPVVYPNENIVDVNFTFFIENFLTGVTKTLYELHRMRHYSIPELKLLANSHQFECILTEEFLTAAPPGINTWGVCLGFKKI